MSTSFAPLNKISNMIPRGSLRGKRASGTRDRVTDRNTIPNISNTSFEISKLHNANDIV